jgi:hypothetical protein
MIRTLRNDRHLSGTCTVLGVLMLFAHLSLLLHDVAPGHTEEGTHCVVCAAWDRTGVATVDAEGVSQTIPGLLMVHREQNERFAVHSFVAIAARGPPQFV